MYFYGTTNSLLLLSTPIIAVLFAVIGIIVGLAATILVFVVRNKSKKSSVDKQIEQMYADADAEIKKLKKEAALEAKEQDLKLRNDFERDTKEKRAELQKMEQRLNQKDELLNKKDSNLLKKN